MSRKTRKLIWSAPLVAVLAVAGALAIFAAQLPGSVFANDLPGTSTGLTAKADGRTAINLSWTAPTDGGSNDGYRIDRSTDGQTWFAHAGDTMANLVQGTSYKDTGLKFGTDYIYRVFAVNDHGVGPTSDDAGATTDDVGAPGKVRNLRATKGRYPTKVVVTWEAPADNGGKPITAYYVNIKASDDGDGFPAEDARFVPTPAASVSSVPETGSVVKVSVETSVCDTNGSSTGATITWEHEDLLAKETYSYKVFASNGSTATDANTQDESDTPVGSTGNPVFPSPVTTLTAIQEQAASAEEKGDAVFLYWIKPESNGGQMIDGYRIHISKNNRDWSRLSDVAMEDSPPASFLTGTDNAAAIHIEEPAGEAAYQFTHASPADSDKTWHYRVYTETTDSDGANEATEIPLRSGRATASLRFGSIVPVPVVVESLTAVGVSYDRIDLAWTAAIWDKDTGFAYVDTADGANPTSDRRTPNGYRIDVSTDGTKWDKVLENNTTLALPEFTDDEARVGKTYYYRVFPLYASRPGPATRTAIGEMTKAPGAPGNVKNLAVGEVSAGRIDITWEAPDDDGGSAITGYRVQHFKNDEDNAMWLQLGTADRLSCQLSATDKGLAAEETRTYRVIALNKQNDGIAGNGIDDGDVGDAVTPVTIPTNIEERQATTTEADLPPAPKGLTVESAKDSNIKSRENRGILVYWNAPDDPDGAPISNYRVERTVKADTASQYGEWEWVQTCLASVGTLLYTHCTDPDEPDLTAGEERMYKVAAQNAAGIGMFTDTVTTPRPAAGHTHAPVAGPEVGPATSVGTGPFNEGGVIQVNWDPAPNATGYIIYAVNVDELDDPDGQIVVAPVNDAAAETFNLGGLKSGNSYDIYVVATAKEMVAWPASTGVPQVAAK